jgi:hypothetical protein
MERGNQWNLPGMWARFGLIHRVVVPDEVDGVIAIVEEAFEEMHWWVFYRLQEDGWEELISFRSYGRHTVLPVEPHHGGIVDVAPAVNPLMHFLLVVEESEYTRWWVLYLEYPEIGSRHVFRYMYLRSLQLSLAVPIEMVREERVAVGSAPDEDSDEPRSGWLLYSSDEE